MKPAFDNPHALEHSERGPAGHAPGCLHRSCPKAGVTWQCVGCHETTTFGWPQIERNAVMYLAAHGEMDAIPLPPCPKCGAVAFLNNADIVRGLDDPHHYTQRAIDEHILQRPKLKGRFSVNPASLTDPKHQGTDFSHLPKGKRPECHVDPEE